MRRIRVVDAIREGSLREQTMKRGKGSLKPVRYFTAVFDLKIHKGLASKSHSPRKSERPGGGRWLGFFFFLRGWLVDLFAVPLSQ